MWNIAAVFIGGGLGAVSRFLLSRFIFAHAFMHFPLGTLVVNISGALLIGFIFALFDAAASSVMLRSLVVIGFLGGYTTFSTYALETVLLLQRHEYAAAGMNLLLHTVTGLVAVVAGMLAATALNTWLQGVFHA
ncbi:MAG: fluoride efflux transporter CrcB [Clostridia bacterium]|jgi:CrcB protein|nr:fluoride efflux transporter CrcB [Spirochaetia bacterium]